MRETEGITEGEGDREGDLVMPDGEDIGGFGGDADDDLPMGDDYGFMSVPTKRGRGRPLNDKSKSRTNGIIKSRSKSIGKVAMPAGNANRSN